MADAYTTSGALNFAATTAYEQMAYFALRDELYFDDCADVKPTRQSHPGNIVTFNHINQLAVAATALDSGETKDVDAVAVTDTTTTVTLLEYGNAVISSAKARGTAYIPVDPTIAVEVGWNAGISQDTLARAPLIAGSNVVYGSGGTTTATARTGVTSDDTVASADIRQVVAALRGANAYTYQGPYYKGFIHPDVSVDLRQDSAASNWVTPADYSDADRRWMGVVGSYEGVMWIEAPRCQVWDAGGTSSTDVYATLVVGRQALAKAYSSAVSAPNAQVVIGPVTDKLRRQRPIGWYWLGGYARFREACLRRIESASSIGDNS